MKVNLLEICTPKQWKTLATCELLESGKYDVYGANGIIGKYDEYNHEFPTVLITCRGATCGNVHLSKPFSYINGNAMALDNLDETKCLNKYLYYYLKGIDLSNSISGSAQPQITIHGLKKINIKLYDLNRQNEIVTNLSKIDNLINLKNNQIHKLEQLVKSQFVEMFGNPVDNTLNFSTDLIGNVCFVTKLAGFEYSKYINYKDTGDVIMIRGLNVKNNKLKLDDVYYIDKYVSDSLPRSQLSAGDICMTYVGINIGDVALVDDKNNYHLAPNVAKISLNDKENYNPLFFVNLLAYNKRRFASSATNTAKQALNMERIRNLKIMIPPIELQNKFAQIVEQIDKQKFEFEKSLKKLEEMQAALMQEYFG